MQIYYARTYRHLEIDKKECLLFLSLFVLPLIVLLFFFYDEITYYMSYVAAYIIYMASGVRAEMVTASFVPGLGPIYYLVLPTVLPLKRFVVWNLVASLLAIWLCSIGPRKGRPIKIYLIITFIIHLITCIFFIFGSDVFLYTLADYSELYVYQELGIWITFTALMGLVMGLLGRGLILLRCITVLSILGYSLLFGTIRYTLFLWLLLKFSVIYMPIMYLALGAFFDFFYFVAIYALCTNKMIKLYNTKYKGVWTWA